MDSDLNIVAFLRVIRACEGTAGPDGYRTRFGGALFDDFDDHPRIKEPFTQTDGKRNYSSAAGAYQFITKTWDRLADKLKLPDFSPLNQDIAALELIREAGAFDDVACGRIEEAIDKCGGIWASLPSSQYPQPKRTMKFALAVFDKFGGMPYADNEDVA